RQTRIRYGLVAIRRAHLKNYDGEKHPETDKFPNIEHWHCCILTEIRKKCALRSHTPRPIISVATRSASTVCFTSCARMMLAPLIMATTAAANEPATRLSGSGSSRSLPIKDLREAPTSIGKPGNSAVKRP